MTGGSGNKPHSTPSVNGPTSIPLSGPLPSLPKPKQTGADTVLDYSTCHKTVNLLRHLPHPHQSPSIQEYLALGLVAADSFVSDGTINPPKPVHTQTAALIMYALFVQTTPKQKTSTTKPSFAPTIHTTANNQRSLRDQNHRSLNGATFPPSHSPRL